MINFTTSEIIQLNVLIDTWSVYNRTPYPANKTVLDEFVEHFRNLRGKNDIGYERCNAIHEYIYENRRHS